MKTSKKFDCVEMKNAIQARLVGRRRGMNATQFLADMDTCLTKSTDPIAEYWKKIAPHRLAASDRRALVAGR